MGMKNLFFVSIDDEFEAEGFFDDEFEFIDGWSGNDGVWRGEYFDGLIDHLGYKVIYLNHKDKQYKMMQKRLKEKMDS
jgi:hypothetical protein